MYKKSLFLKLFCLVIGLLVLLNFTNITYMEEIYTWSNPNSYVEASNLDSEKLENSSINNIESNSLNLDCGSAILIDQHSGQILYEQNSHEQLRPASVTKVMSILLIMEALDSGQIKLTDKVPCSEKASSMGGSQIWLTTTENLTVDDMLKSICVVSANDCTVAMAEFLCGSTESFVQKMNDRAKELGMNDTCFKNCHGIDEDGHVTSSYDISVMSRELLEKHPTITRYTTIWMDSIREGKSELVNTNKLVRNYAGCTGLKTGSTSLALYNLVASATRDDLSFIAVIMKAPTTALRFDNAKTLLDYGFSNYSNKNISTANEIVKNVKVEKGVESSLNAIYFETKNYTIPKGKESCITEQISIPDTLSAPISKGQKIGEISYYLDDNIIGTVDIVSDRAVQKNGFFSMSSFVLKKWFTILR